MRINALENVFYVDGGHKYMLRVDVNEIRGEVE